jgi:tRNA-uridine 2-sulfurtransferase
MKSQHSKKVFVGLSGGVDSAVSAAILKKNDYEVTGVFIKVWQPDWILCNWKEERKEAMRVAAHLEIPFITLDLEKEYKKGVIDYMIAEYKAGRTPNPDVMCNREIKFGAFWRFAKSQGADYIATGHYARIINHSQTKNVQIDILNPLRRRREQELCIPLPDGAEKRQSSRHFSPVSARLIVGEEYQFAHSLFAGLDKNKDQSYFLWTLNQNDLAHILFPVGNIEKTDVRKLAHKFKLPNADKKDSQGLCFIGKVDVKDFLAHYIKTESGNVLSENGEVIGEHPGALFFTIGERHGFTISRKTPNDDRYYVIDKDIEQNTITVASEMKRKEQSEKERITRIGNINWVSGSAYDNSSNTERRYPLQARSRYRETLQNIKIVSVNMFEILVEFEKPQSTLASGQSLVIYHGDECLGGGIIE